MSVLFDILIYVIFAFFASYLAKRSLAYDEINGFPTSDWNKYLTYFVLFFAIIGGIRWNVGSDCLAYSHIFQIGYKQVETKEFIWRIFVNFVKNIGFHWSIGLGLCTFVQIWFVTKSLQRYKFLLVFLPFVFLVEDIGWMQWELYAR